MTVTVTGLDELDRDLERKKKKFLKQFVEFHRSITIRAYQKALEFSPVWSGWYRASHRVAVNSPDKSIAPRPSVPQRWPAPVPGPARAKAPGIAEARRKLVALKPFEITWLSNNAPHAARIERGHSPQAPAPLYVYKRVAMIVSREASSVVFDLD